MSRFDVLVVLGAALARDGGPGPALAERMDAGMAAWKTGVAPLILVTGVGEAIVMEWCAIKAGVPAKSILVEDRARTTREYALFSRELMRAHGLSRAAIVTQAFHRRRSVAAFRRVGVDAEALEFSSRRPPAHARVRELAALLIYQLRGWI